MMGTIGKLRSQGVDPEHQWGQGRTFLPSQRGEQGDSQENEGIMWWQLQGPL